MTEDRKKFHLGQIVVDLDQGEIWQVGQILEDGCCEILNEKRRLIRHPIELRPANRCEFEDFKPSLQRERVI